MNNGGIPNHGSRIGGRCSTPANCSSILSFCELSASAGILGWDTRFVLGAFQQYLRNQNMFCIWDVTGQDSSRCSAITTIIPKRRWSRTLFLHLGRELGIVFDGALIETLGVVTSTLGNCGDEEPGDHGSASGSSLIRGKERKSLTRRPFVQQPRSSCGSSSDLDHIAASATISSSPTHRSAASPLCGIVRFLLRLAAAGSEGHGIRRIFARSHPNALEAVANRPATRTTPMLSTRRFLTQCWREAARILKPCGILAFTFHHSEDEPWVAVLESLFDAGFYLEATYPIRSDETKGEGGNPARSARKRSSTTSFTSAASGRKNRLK